MSRKKAHGSDAAGLSGLCVQRLARGEPLERFCLPS